MVQETRCSTKWCVIESHRGNYPANHEHHEYFWLNNFANYFDPCPVDDTGVGNFGVKRKILFLLISFYIFNCQNRDNFRTILCLDPKKKSFQNLLKRK